jgi:hypothetical protein
MLTSEGLSVLTDLLTGLLQQDHRISDGPLTG